MAMDAYSLLLSDRRGFSMLASVMAVAAVTTGAYWVMSSQLNRARSEAAQRGLVSWYQAVEKFESIVVNPTRCASLFPGLAYETLQSNQQVSSFSDSEIWREAGLRGELGEPQNAGFETIDGIVDNDASGALASLPPATMLSMGLMRLVNVSLKLQPTQSSGIMKSVAKNLKVSLAFATNGGELKKCRIYTNKTENACATGELPVGVNANGELECKKPNLETKLPSGNCTGGRSIASLPAKGAPECNPLPNYKKHDADALTLIVNPHKLQNDCQSIRKTLVTVLAEYTFSTCPGPPSSGNPQWIVDTNNSFFYSHSQAPGACGGAYSIGGLGNGAGTFNRDLFYQLQAVHPGDKSPLNSDGTQPCLVRRRQLDTGGPMFSAGATPPGWTEEVVFDPASSTQRQKFLTGLADWDGAADYYNGNSVVPKPLLDGGFPSFIYSTPNSFGGCSSRVRILTRVTEQATCGTANANPPQRPKYSSGPKKPGGIDG
ncbi:MAG: hypothetical protein AB7P04_15035 [Bacteriovoracia bacterium]